MQNYIKKNNLEITNIKGCTKMSYIYKIFEMFLERTYIYPTFEYLKDLELGLDED